MDELAAIAFTAYRALVYETPEFVELLPRGHADRGDRRAQHRQPAGVAHGVDAHRGPARDPVGVQLGAVPVDAARLVRLRLGGRNVDGRRRATSSPLLARNARAVAVLPQRAVQHGDGAREDRPRGRVALRGAGARRERCASPSSRALRPSTRAPSSRTSRSRGARELLADNPTLARSIRNRFPYLDPLNHVQVELLRRYRAGQTDERTKRADPSHDQRLGGGAAQQRLARGTRLGKAHAAREP